MLDSHVKFHSTNGKRLILIVDDEEINREILGAVLEQKYEVLYAETGESALDIIRQHKDMLSLVLLDLILPGIHGFDVLKEVKSDPVTAKIPIIVLTADTAAEVQSLTLGAIDFIAKPYPEPDIIHARVQKTIELSEDRDIIRSTERDSVTGLYNKEYFYRYAEQFDKYHKDTVMDAVVVNINHFRLINERYGRERGNQTLKVIGERLRDRVSDAGGIVCRRESDIFLVYCPQRSDYEEILDYASSYMEGEEQSANIRLRMGIYSDVDKDIDVERRFDRAKMAADTVRNIYSKAIAYYDRKLHDEELFNEQLVEDFSRAIDEKQFVVNYQPKYDIRKRVPVLSSAEALVRWHHPQFGMISPGRFVPLFEENGLIQKLDFYVWREVAAQMAHWHAKYEKSIPVSVNFSRVDLYEPSMLPYLKGIVEEYRIKTDDFLLEITESAYTDDSDWILETVGQLRSEGFLVEMDDFGSGYSSLNMISTLPIDALKLDMMFIRTALENSKDVRIIEVIVEIARHLNVPVIAEGVESEEQLKALKDIGCDYVQGYYFSKPVPAAEYEMLIESEHEKDDQASGTGEPVPAGKKAAGASEGAAAASGREAEASDSGAREEDPGQDAGHKALKLKTAGILFAIMAFVLGIGLFVTDSMVTTGHERLIQSQERFVLAQNAAAELESGSDYLTEQVRSFVVTGDIAYMNNFIHEVEVDQSRDKAVDDLELLLEGNDSDMFAHLSKALTLSNELVNSENLAMKYTCMAEDIDETLAPEVVRNTTVDAGTANASADQLKGAATELVFGDDYAQKKKEIKENTAICTEELIEISNQEVQMVEQRMDLLLDIQTALTLLLILAVVAFLIFIVKWINQPLSHIISAMKKKESVGLAGASEIRYVASTYNNLLAETMKSHENLEYQALHDKLTGLFNRTAYEGMTPDIDMNNSALILVDVDEFKTVNDTYGHDVGDEILKKVAHILKDSFRSVDQIYRLGGDEFVVIMMRVDSSLAGLVKDKIARANAILSNPEDGLPKVSLSAGVAFGDRENPQGDIFKDADTALYRVKEAGRNGCSVF